MPREHGYLSEADLHLRYSAQMELRQRLKFGPIAIDEWFSRLTRLYYENSVIGEDFPTPPELFPQMGRSVARLALKAFEHMGSPQEFVVYEAGGGNGTLMSGFLQEAYLHQDFFDALVYHEIEQSSHLIFRQSGNLTAFPHLEEKVFWHQADVCSFEFPEHQSGMYIAIENDDDLPSKAVYKRNGVPTELYITFEGDRVVQKELSASDQLLQFISEQRAWWDLVPENLRIPLPIHMQSVRLRQRLLQSFDSLLIFTTDYGYELAKEAKHMPNWIFPQCKTFMHNTKKFFLGDEYASMYDFAGIANHTSNVDFSLLAFPGIRDGCESFIINNRDFLFHHGLQEYATAHVLELLENQRIPEAILYLRRLAGVIDITNDWTTLIQWKGINADITVGIPSDGLVSWLYDFVRKHNLGEIQPENRKGPAR